MLAKGAPGAHNNTECDPKLDLNEITEMTFVQTFLTHCGLVTPYGDMELGQHWLR